MASLAIFAAESIPEPAEPTATTTTAPPSTPLAPLQSPIQFRRATWVPVLRLFVDPTVAGLRDWYTARVDAHNAQVKSDPFANAGFDLVVPGTITSITNGDDGSAQLVSLGVKAEMQTEYQRDDELFDVTSFRRKPTGFLLCARSSVAKTRLTLANSVGVIDAGYRGYLGAAFRVAPIHAVITARATGYYGDRLHAILQSNESVVVPPETRLVQICHPGLRPFRIVLVDSADELSATVRGEGGFGSTNVISMSGRGPDRGQFNAAALSGRSGALRGSVTGAPGPVGYVSGAVDGAVHYLHGLGADAAEHGSVAEGQAGALKSVDALVGGSDVADGDVVDAVGADAVVVGAVYADTVVVVGGGADEAGGADKATDKVTDDADVYRKYVLFPLQNMDIWGMYKQHVDSFWHTGEVDLTKDVVDWDTKLTDDERHFLSMVLAFFAASDGIVVENLALRFMGEVTLPEARAFYGFQIAMENIHSEMYSLLIDTLVREPAAKNKLFSAIQTFPCIAQKARWAKAWIDSGAGVSFATRLVAFACVEGIFFSSSFASIYWIKKRGLLPGLTFSNNLIARDESLHTDFAVLLHNTLGEARLGEAAIFRIVGEAVAIETEFVVQSLPCRLIGMNAGMMTQYIQFVADRLCLQLGCASKLFGASNPFDFMELISIDTKVNFFERTNAEYALANKTLDEDTFTFAGDDF